MYKKFSLFSLFFLFPLVAFANTKKTEINIKTGSNDIELYGDGMVDQGTKDIISAEYDYRGNLINCTIGKSSKRRDLPSCNEVIEKRTNEEERVRKVQQKEFERQRQEQERSNKLFAKKKSTTKSFTFPDGLKINTINLTNTNRPIAGDKCWVINCEIKDTCNFWLSFEKDDISSLKSISLSKPNQKPSIIESFLIDEKRITLKLIISRVLQRLNGQKLIGVN